MIVTVTRDPKETLEEAINGAINVAKLLNSHIEFLSPNVRLIVTPDDTLDAVAARYALHLEKGLDKQSKYK